MATKKDYKLHPEKLINSKGRMLFITFARAASTRTNAIKVEVGKQYRTMLGLAASANFDEQYEKAINFVLNATGAEPDEELRKHMTNTKYAFLRDFKISFKIVPVTYIVFSEPDK